MQYQRGLEIMLQTLIMLIPILITAALTDIYYGKIFNWLTFPAMLIGIIYQFTISGFPDGLWSLAGLVVGMACYLPFYIMGGTGAGDVKLMGGVGAFLGPKGVFYAFIWSTLVGGVYAVLLLIWHGMFVENITRYWHMVRNALFYRKFFYIPPANPAAMPVLKYGLAIAVGTIGYLLHEIL